MLFTLEPSLSSEACRRFGNFFACLFSPAKDVAASFVRRGRRSRLPPEQKHTETNTVRIPRGPRPCVVVRGGSICDFLVVFSFKHTPFLGAVRLSAGATGMR